LNYILYASTKFQFSGELCATHNQFILGHFLDTYQELLFIFEYREPARFHFAALVHCTLNPHVPTMYFPTVPYNWKGFVVGQAHVSNQIAHNYFQYGTYIQYDKTSQFREKIYGDM